MEPQKIRAEVVRRTRIAVGRGYRGDITAGKTHTRIDGKSYRFGGRRSRMANLHGVRAHFMEQEHGLEKRKPVRFIKQPID